MGTTDVLHYHEGSHISLILNGRMVDKRKTSETERASGDIMFFHAGEPHQSINRIFPSVCINLELEPAYLQENRIPEGQLGLSVTKDADAKFTMLRIYRELLIKDAVSGSSIEMLMLQLLAGAHRLHSVRPSWVDSVVQLLNDSWDEPLTLRDLSHAAGVHPITISKHFPRFFSCTLGEYRRRLRVEKALALIKESSLSLTEIAYKCGFADQSHFTRTFKLMTGFLPRHYESI